MRSSRTVTRDSQRKRGGSHAPARARAARRSPGASAEQASQRAERLLRAGDVRGALRELRRARAGPAGGDRRITLALAETLILGGDLVGGRQLLRELDPLPRGLRLLARRRAIVETLAAFLEDRYDRAVAWARRGRRFGPGPPLPRESLALLLEVVALLGLEQTDRAAALAERVAGLAPDGTSSRCARGLEAACVLAVRWRRGEFAECVAAGAPHFDCGDRSGDAVAHAVLCRLLAWAARGLGQLPRAERLLRTGAGVSADRGLRALLPLLEAEAASLAAARGDDDEARDRTRGALEQLAGSPYLRVESWVLEHSSASPPAEAGAPRAVRAFAQLRLAERALETGELDLVAPAAEHARVWYARAGAMHEVARARLARAEACLRLGRDEEAETEVSLCERLAARFGYVPIHTAAAFLRAAQADRAGDLERYASALARARERAGDQLTDAALVAACTRVGLTVAPAGGVAEFDCWRALVGRLRLARPASALVSDGRRAWLVGPDDPLPPGADLVVDLEREVTHVGDARLSMSPQRLELLVTLAEAGPRGCRSEELYRAVWGGQEYHPLRHRNTVYVALGRLRQVLEPHFHGPIITVSESERYRLAPTIAVMVRRPLPRDAHAALRRRCDGYRPGSSPDPAAHARRFALDPVQARWDVAVLDAERGPRGAAAPAERPRPRRGAVKGGARRRARSRPS